MLCEGHDHDAELSAEELEVEILTRKPFIACSRRA